MQTSETDQIVSQFKRVIRRRKWFIFLCVLAVTGPIVYYNHTTDPTYESTTTMVFDEFVGPMRSFNMDYSHEVMTANRLQELESYAFAKEVARALPSQAIAKIELPEAEDRPEDFEESSYLARKVSKSMTSFAVRNSNLVTISVQMGDPELCRMVANTAATVFQERNQRIKEEGVSGIRRFVEEQLRRFQVQLDVSEEALKQYKEDNKITSFDRQSQEILQRLTEAEVLFNAATAERQALEQRLSSIQENLAEQRRLAPSVTEVASPWAQRLRERLVELQLQYTQLKVQEYDPAHPKMIQLIEDIEQTKRTLTEKALKIADGEFVVDPLSQIENYVSESISLQIEVESLKAQEKALRNAIREYDRTLSALPEKELNLARLTRERDVNQKIFNNLLEKLEESKLSQAQNLPSIRIIDEAQVNTTPIRPRKKLNIAAGLMFGIITGFGLGFIRENMRGGLDSSHELQRLIGWNVVGSIPKITKLPPAKLKHATGKKRSERESRRIKRSLISILEPHAGPAEAYRMLRTNLQFHGLGESCKTLLVTSVAPDDGKSTVVSNLAISMATMGEKTLLLDAEVRHPGMHLIFDVEQKPGLSDVLVADASQRVTAGRRQKELAAARAGMSPGTAEVELEDSGTRADDAAYRELVDKTIQRTRVRNLRILGAGTTMPNTSDTISSHEVRMKRLLDTLKERYGAVIIDCPPLSLVHDAALMAKLVDGVLFVINSTSCDKDMLLNCKHVLERSGANVIGAVLNHIEPIGVYKTNKYYHSKKN